MYSYMDRRFIHVARFKTAQIWVHKFVFWVVSQIVWTAQVWLMEELQPLWFQVTLVLVERDLCVMTRNMGLSPPENHIRQW